MVTLNANLVHYRELCIVGAYGSKPRLNRLALDLLAAGKLKTSSLCTKFESRNRLSS